MNFKDVLVLTIKSLYTNPLRSFLSSLGVFMGVFAINGTLQVSDMGKTYIKNQLQEMESPQIFIQQPYNSNTNQLKQYRMQDLELLKKKLPGWTYITPLADIGTEDVFYTNKKIKVQAQAVATNFLQASGRKLVLGNFFTVNDSQQNYPVVAVDQVVAQTLYKNKNPIGKKIYLENKYYYIKAVIQSKKSELNNPKQGLILLPLFLYQSMKSTFLFDKIIITVSYAGDLDKIQEQAVAILEEKLNNVSIYAYSNIEFLKLLEKVLNGVTIILLIIGGISLVVGGVGIANITIASIIERTSEIGLRRAIGATKKDILIQFLLEATIISMTGGIVAIIFVQSITIVVVNLFTLPYEFNYQIPLISLSSAVGLGIISSFLPAHKASKLDPVEALRSK
jgi:putative ABC transport system permease protein